MSSAWRIGMTALAVGVSAAGVVALSGARDGQVNQRSGNSPARAAQAERSKRAVPGRSLRQNQGRIRREAGSPLARARNNQVSGRDERRLREDVAKRS